MTIKNLAASISLATILFAVPAIASAQTVSPVPTEMSQGKMNRHEMRMNPTENLDTLKAKGDQLITERLASLNKMLTRIQNVKKLSDAEKTTYTTSINTAITGLTNLKTKIDADTDLTTLKTDIKSIYTDYRVYAEFDPQTNILASTDAVNTSLDQLTQLATKLQSRISSASAAENDVTRLQNLLTDMQNSITDAKTQTTTIQTNISNLTPAAYNANPTATHQTILNTRSLFSTVKKDLQSALQDARQIMIGLKVLRKPKVSITPTSATSAATVTP